MKAFMDEDFLLHSDTARALYHDFAEKMPIADFHNHLPAGEIASRHEYENLTRLWLMADHYKWRVLRACGVPEKYITGKDTSDKDKFLRYAAVMPRLIGNPVYHWTHLELKRYFGIDTPLSADTAEDIWRRAGEMLRAGGMDAVSLLQRMDVRVLCTTDDPADALEDHKALSRDPSLPFRVLPTFRPDKYLHIQHPAWREAVARLGAARGGIVTWDVLLTALSQALDRFCALGCRGSDHGFTRFMYAPEGNPEKAMHKALAGEAVTDAEAAAFEGALLRFLAGEYARRDLVMQLHLGAMRDNSPRLLARLGADAGGDSMGEATNPFLLSRFLGDLERADALPKTILYNLNPCDGPMLATLAVDFSGDGIPGRVQYGAAWWFQDHIRGMDEQLNQLMDTGLLSSFVGMLTDSRAFTSFVRHEYFRRILCQKVGELVEKGEYPRDMNALGSLVQSVCYDNAVSFFGFDKR